MKNLLTVFLFMLMVVFVYASIGLQLYSDIDFDNINANFYDLPKGLQLMVISATGEFSGYMTDALDESSVPHAVTYIFFITFVLMMSFLFVNMFVMFIVETFELLRGDTVNLTIESIIPEYTEVWAKYDPKATGFIDSKHLDQLIIDLPAEIGIKVTTTASTKHLFLLLLLLHIQILW
eukprot:CAMPEP_0117769194 /NCGR_PEP_ID=MMETSP0947-20121206/22875_1 /TAXON_ID=44440 /ORGANISM="Chattonella subsalsa, Strain CCMP2191" /LENGTH=177 /DNA_ID=CAMNT_0005593619 /DNA_START=452 /DNA_END=982 /DNA_ORIENTATION=+